MKTIKNRFLKTAALLLTTLSVGLVACDRDPVDDLSPEDSQVFITNHDRTVNFATFKTFAIVDSVTILSNERDARPSATSRDLALIARIAENLRNRGYVQVARTEKPDLGLNVSIISNTYVGVVNNNPYGGGYGGGNWGGGFGGGFYYPPSYSYYQVSDNYWYTEAIDLKNPVTGQGGQPQLKVIWNAEIRGDGIFDTVSTNRIVDAVFAQSDYFKTTR